MEDSRPRRKNPDRACERSSLAACAGHRGRRTTFPRAEIGHFFEVYKALEPSKFTEVRGWQGRSEALAAHATESNPIGERARPGRWLPMALPIGWLMVNGVTALAILISALDGWTYGDRVALRSALLGVVMATVLALGSFLAIHRADQDDHWRWVAWASSGSVMAYFILR